MSHCDTYHSSSSGINDILSIYLNEIDSQSQTHTTMYETIGRKYKEMIK